MTKNEDDNVPQHRPDSEDQWAMGQVANGDIEVLTPDQAKALRLQWRDEDEAMDKMISSEDTAEDEQPALNSEANSAALLELLDDEDEE